MKVDITDEFEEEMIEGRYIHYDGDIEKLVEFILALDRDCIWDWNGKELVFGPKRSPIIRYQPEKRRIRLEVEGRDTWENSNRLEAWIAHEKRNRKTEPKAKGKMGRLKRCVELVHELIEMREEREESEE